MLLSQEPDTEALPWPLALLARGVCLALAGCHLLEPLQVQLSDLRARALEQLSYVCVTHVLWVELLFQIFYVPSLIVRLI